MPNSSVIAQGNSRRASAEENADKLAAALEAQSINSVRRSNSIIMPSPSPSAGTLLGGPLRPQDALIKGETIDEKLIKNDLVEVKSIDHLCRSSLTIFTKRIKRSEISESASMMHKSPLE
jgi:hypothetical protein